MSTFAVWEKFFAPITCILYSFLVRTVFGAWILSAAQFASCFCWASYFGSFLIVVNKLSVADASYIVQAYTVGTVLCNLAIGVLIHNTRRFKNICLYSGMLLSILRMPDGQIPSASVQHRQYRHVPDLYFLQHRYCHHLRRNHCYGRHFPSTYCSCHLCVRTVR